MRKMILCLLACLLLSACQPSQESKPTVTPVPFTLNTPDEITRYLSDWASTAQEMGYPYEVMDVTPEQDANGNVTAWFIRVRDPSKEYKNGMCVVPIIGLSQVIKNYLDSGRQDDVASVAPKTLAVIKVNCFDSEGTDQQLISVKWSDVVAFGKGALTTNRMLTKITVEP